MINKTLLRRIKLSASPWKVAKESSTSSSIEMLTDLMLFNYFLDFKKKRCVLPESTVRVISLNLLYKQISDL